MSGRRVNWLSKKKRARNIEDKTNAYLFHGLKQFDLVGCHCYSEYCQAALLEADPSVTDYIEQPESIPSAGKTHYFPDFKVWRGSEITYLEVKNDEDESSFYQKHQPAVERIRRRGFKFEMVLNSALKPHYQLADNIHELIARVLTGLDIDDDAIRERLLSELIGVMEKNPARVRDFVDISHRHETYHEEICLYRLLLDRQICSDLTEATLSPDTALWLPTS